MLRRTFFKLLYPIGLALGLKSSNESDLDKFPQKFKVGDNVIWKVGNSNNRETVGQIVEMSHHIIKNININGREDNREYIYASVRLLKTKLIYYINCDELVYL